jgi:hypothetical protein
MTPALLHHLSTHVALISNWYYRVHPDHSRAFLMGSLHSRIVHQVYRKRGSSEIIYGWRTGRLDKYTDHNPIPTHQFNPKGWVTVDL